MRFKCVVDILRYHGGSDPALTSGCIHIWSALILYKKTLDNEFQYSQRKMNS